MLYTKEVFLLSIDSACKRHRVSISCQYCQMCCSSFDWHVISGGAIVTWVVCFAASNVLP